MTIVWRHFMLVKFIYFCYLWFWLNMDWKLKLDSFEASQSWCKSLLFKLIFSPEMNVGLLCFVLCIWSVLWKFQKPSHFRNFQRKLQMPPSKQTLLKIFMTRYKIWWNLNAKSINIHSQTIRSFGQILKSLAHCGTRPS